MSTVQADIDALLKDVALFRIGGHEFRLQPLPIKKLLAVIKYLEANVDLLDKAKAIGGDPAAGGVSVSGFLDAEVYRRLNALLRLLFTQEQAEKLTDDWCAEHLSNAHYRAFVEAALKQNQLDGLFRWAQALMGTAAKAAAEALRQKLERPAAPTAALE